MFICVKIISHNLKIRYSTWKKIFIEMLDLSSRLSAKHCVFWKICSSVIYAMKWTIGVSRLRYGAAMGRRGLWMRVERVPIKYRPGVASFSRRALWKYEIMKKLPQDSILKGGPRESDRFYEPFKRPDSGHHFCPAAEQCAAICHAFQSVLDVPLIGIQMDINISHRWPSPAQDTAFDHLLPRFLI